MTDTSDEHDGRDGREQAWACQDLEANRARLDLIFEAYFPRVYRLAHHRTANQAEAERVTEAVFRSVLPELASRTDGGPSVLLAIFGATRRELRKVAGPSTGVATPSADPSRRPRIASR